MNKKGKAGRQTGNNLHHEARYTTLAQTALSDNRCIDFKRELIMQVKLEPYVVVNLEKLELDRKAINKYIHKRHFMSLNLEP